MMTLTITPSRGPSLPVPEEGEEVCAVTSGAGKGPVRPVLQGLANWLGYVDPRAFYGGSIAHPRPTIRSSDGASIVVGPFVAFSPNDAAVLATVSELTLTVAVMEGAPANYSANAWHYIYAKNNAGSVQFVISLTAPSLDLNNKNADLSLRYLGCFRTSGTAVIPFRGRGTTGYRYDEPQSIFAAQNPTVWTVASLATRVPPTAMFAQCIMGNSIGTGALLHTVSLRPNGSTAATGTTLKVGHSPVIGPALTDFGQSFGFLETEIGTDSLQRIEYKVDSNTGVGMSLDVIGWRE